MRTIIQIWKGKTNYNYLITTLIVIVGSLFIVMNTVNSVSYGLSKTITEILFIAISFTAGLFHACFDFIIFENNTKQFKPSLLHIIYLVSIVIVTSLWIISPDLALIAFLIVTAIHFGKTDYTIFKLKVNFIAYFTYGILLLIWLFVNHLEELKISLAAIEFYSINKLLSYLSAEIVLWIKFLSLIMFSTLIIINRFKIRAILNLLMILLIFKYLTLNQSFLIYFGFWHSFHSILLIRKKLGSEFINKSKKALSYLIMTYVFLIVFIFLFPLSKTNSLLYCLIFISLLSFTHTLIMHKILNSI